MRFPTFPPSPSRRRRQFTDFAVAVKTWVFIPLFLSCTLHFFFFFSFLISTNHLGDVPSNSSGFLYSLHRQKSKNNRRRRFSEDKTSYKDRRVVLRVYRGLPFHLLCFPGVVWMMAGSARLLPQLEGLFSQTEIRPYTLPHSCCSGQSKRTRSNENLDFSKKKCRIAARNLHHW